MYFNNENEIETSKNKNAFKIRYRKFTRKENPRETKL